MADPVSNAQKKLQQARDEREQRATDFYQEKINAGRALRQAREGTTDEQTQTRRNERTERQPRSPYRARER